MSCYYDVQGFLQCNKKPLTMMEKFENNEDKKYDVQCGFMTSKYDAEQKCGSCCGKNGMLWKGDFYNTKVNDFSTPDEPRTFCKCEPKDEVTIIADHELVVDPLVLERLNKKVWSLGDLNMSQCVNRCVSLPSCKYVIHKENQCWMSDVDPALTTKNMKSGAFTIIKK